MTYIKVIMEPIPSFVFFQAVQHIWYRQMGHGVYIDRLQDTVDDLTLNEIPLILSNISALTYGLESNTSSFGLLGERLDNVQNDVEYLEKKLHELNLRELNLENRLHELIC